MTTPIILKVYEDGRLKLARAFREGRVRLGSGQVDLQVNGPGVAPHHAMVEVGGLGAIVRALSSAPVYLNGQPVLVAPLRHGDLITLGEARVMVELRATSQGQQQAPAGPRPRLQLIHGDEPHDRKSHGHAAPALAVVREQGQDDEALMPGEELRGEQPAYETEVTPPEAPMEDPPAEPPAQEPPRSVPPVREPPRRDPPVREPPAQAPARKPPPVQAGARAAPAAPAQDAGCVLAELFWSQTRLSVWQLGPGEQLFAGSGAGCDAHLPGVARVSVLRDDAGSWQLLAPRPLALTLVEEGGEVSGGVGLLARGRARVEGDGLCLTLPESGTCVLSAGVLQLRVRRVALASRAPKEPGDWKGVLAASVAAVLFVALMRVLSHVVPLPPRETPTPELISSRPRIVRAAAHPIDPEAQRTAPAQPQARREPGRAVARHAGPEGEAGAPTAPRRNARAERRNDDRASIANTGLLLALGNGAGRSDVFGAALERGTRDALGHLVGPRVADAHGAGGLGMRGLGSGGGGDGSGLGLARIGTNGIGGGQASYGEGRGGLKGKSDAEIGLAPGEPQVIGHIDPELIRRVVHDHRAQIRTCYELQLNARPDLAGKLIAAWTIDAQGNVTEAHTQESALHDRAVESCVSARIRGWRFPLPKGGGEVFVTYPFIFTPGG